MSKFYEGYVSLFNVEDGAPGKPGADASKFVIETSQDEILKFYKSTASVYEDEENLTPASNETIQPVESEDREWVFSPEELNIQIFNQEPTQLNGGSYIAFQSINDVSLSVFDHEKGWIVISPFAIGEINLNESYLKLEPNSKETLFFNLKDLKTKLEEIENMEAAAQKPYLEWLAAVKTLIEQETILKIEYKNESQDNIFLSSNYIQVRYGMNDDMAKFSLEADGIYQSIQSTALAFDASGLTIQNGGIKVYNKNQEKVFSFNNNSGDLEITGIIYAEGGHFKGVLSGATGDFSGEIIAKSGTIGGFTIDEGVLTSTDGTLKLSGSTGKITAEKIELGTGALIKEYIKIGDNVKLQTPTVNDNNFITVTNNGSPTIQMSQNGLISLGNGAIKLDGANQIISGSNWTIEPNLATFENIVINGSIKAATFEYGEISSVGGVIFVRPSSRIVKIKDDKIYLEASVGFSQNDYCRVGSNYYTIQNITDNEITFNEDISALKIGDTIVNMGTESSIGIGINGSNGTLFDLMPNAITVNEFNTDNNIKTLKPKVILGKLPKDFLGNDSKVNYGLYADNVILNGQLTTGVNELKNIYSGIGTRIYEDAPSTKDMTDRFPDIKLSNGEIRATPRGQILIWAGAKDKDNIKNAKFFVDEYGNMYAGSGYFDGTIITNSTIRASRIETLTIAGTDGNGKSAGLTIQDVDNGIDFVKNGASAFKLGTSGIITNLALSSFNKIQTESEDGIISPVFCTATFANNIPAKQMTIRENYLQCGNTKFITKNDSLELKPGGVENLVVKEDLITLQGNVQYKQGQKVLYEYKQTKIGESVVGYDIYVY